MLNLNSLVGLMTQKTSKSFARTEDVPLAQTYNKARKLFSRSIFFFFIVKLFIYGNHENVFLKY